MFSFNYSTSVRVLMILTCALSLAGCAAQVAPPEYAPHDSSVNSLDWAGSYHGVLPCADCAGIETTLILDYDLTYRIITRYDSGEPNSFEQQGRFTWLTDGNTIRLEGITTAPDRYHVGENRLIQLDMQGERITGALAERYVLDRQDPGVTPANR